MILRKNLICLLCFTACALSLWSIFLLSKSNILTTTDTSHEKDGFMEGVIAVAINKQGEPALKLETPMMVHYPDNDTTELATPHVIIYRHSTEPWHINAKYAKSTQGLTEITFWNNVVIHHLPDKSNPFTTIHTETLTIIPNQHIAKTDDRITVTQPNMAATGIGMLADWNNGTVQLQNAKEEYVPNG